VKLSRIVASGAAIALLTGSVLVGGGAAIAADTHYTAGQFGVEGSSYPASGWFQGKTKTPSGTITSTATGLSVVGPVQILNSTTPKQGLLDLVKGAHLNVVSGDANFQIALYLNNEGANTNTGFTTLRPNSFNEAGLNPEAGWTTSGPIGDWAAGSSHTLAEYADALGELSNHQILAYGAIVPAGITAVISSITWGGNTSIFSAVAAPAVPVPGKATFTG
jgi:hypothetical protein